MNILKEATLSELEDRDFRALTESKKVMVGIERDRIRVYVPKEDERKQKDSLYRQLLGRIHLN